MSTNVDLLHFNLTHRVWKAAIFALAFAGTVQRNRPEYSTGSWGGLHLGRRVEAEGCEGVAFAGLQAGLLSFVAALRLLRYPRGLREFFGLRSGSINLRVVSSFDCGRAQ